MPAPRASRFRPPLAFVMRRPGRTLACVVGAGLVTGIILNAVMFQTARHPAPLFAAPGANVAAAKPTPPMPAPRPASVASATPAIQPAAAQPAAPAPRMAEPAMQPRVAEPAAASAPASSKKDPIGALIKSEGIAESTAPPARVAAVQKALIKSGFVLRADGVMGASTRQALERFEQERKLPVTGDLSPRTLRELSAQSGVAIP